MNINMEKIDSVIEKVNKMAHKQAESSDFFSPLWVIDYHVIQTALDYYKEHVVAPSEAAKQIEPVYKNNH